VRKEHPEFFDRWNELAKDEDGNSLYYSKLDYLFKMFGIQKSYDETFSFEDNFLGFFSNYSRSNIWEDIAVTSTTLEMPGWKYYIKSILDHNDESGNIKRKISLAREYGLLP